MNDELMRARWHTSICVCVGGSDDGDDDVRIMIRNDYFQIL